MKRTVSTLVTALLALPVLADLADSLKPVSLQHSTSTRVYDANMSYNLNLLADAGTAASNTLAQAISLKQDAATAATDAELAAVSNLAANAVVDWTAGTSTTTISNGTVKVVSSGSMTVSAGNGHGTFQIDSDAAVQGGLTAGNISVNEVSGDLGEFNEISLSLPPDAHDPDAVGNIGFNDSRYLQISDANRPYLRIKIPFVDTVKYDGYTTNIQTFTCLDDSGDSQTISVTNITMKLNPLYNLKWCDFVIKAVAQDSQGDAEVKYVYHSTDTPDGDTGAEYEEVYADVYYLNTSYDQPRSLQKTLYTKSNGHSIQNESGNAATHIEVWPDTTRLSQAGITENSSNTIWVCRLLNGVGEYLDPQTGKTKWFHVETEWRKDPPSY